MTATVSICKEAADLQTIHFNSLYYRGSVDMKYTELKQQISEEVNSFPMMFAFSDEQFKEGLKKLGTWIGAICSIGAGGFIRKSDSEAFGAMFDRHNKIMATALKDNDFLTDAIEYELANHEYIITYDPEPALSALGISEKDIDDRVRDCFQKARKSYLHACEVNGWG